MIKDIIYYIKLLLPISSKPLCSAPKDVRDRGRRLLGQSIAGRHEKIHVDKICKDKGESK